MNNRSTKKRVLKCKLLTLLKSLTQSYHGTIFKSITSFLRKYATDICMVSFKICKVREKVSIYKSTIKNE